MLTPVIQATEMVLAHTLSLPESTVSLMQGLGGILRENVIADRDFPPFDRVAMDGIAIRYETYERGQRIFAVAGTQAAGSPQQQLTDSVACMEVMTGAVLPNGTDTVIRYEDVSLQDGKATINVPQVKARQNVHHRATDRSAGAVLIPAGTRITAAEVATAASVGHRSWKIAKMPRAAIISTGDELVEIDQLPLPHQIRKSNVYAVQAALRTWGVTGDVYHLMDEVEHIRAELQILLARYDFLVLSGGVSKGKFDYVPQVLEELGVTQLFHRVQQKPGKPFWFGYSPSTVVFALPGNPVSTFMCVYRYVQPWLRASLGLAPLQPTYAVLEETFHFKPNLTHFLQVRLRYAPNGICYARPLKGKGSGDLTNLNEVDGFLELSAESDTFEAGTAHPVWQFR